MSTYPDEDTATLGQLKNAVMTWITNGKKLGSAFAENVQSMQSLLDSMQGDSNDGADDITKQLYISAFNEYSAMIDVAKARQLGATADKYTGTIDSLVDTLKTELDEAKKPGGGIFDGFLQALKDTFSSVGLGLGVGVVVVGAVVLVVYAGGPKKVLKAFGV